MFEFSIIIPVYNAEQYLDKCLQSIKVQIGKNCEIILVDDGSTDSSGRICDDYHAMHPEYISVIHKKNEGQIAARMTGVSASNGKYICFVDADDTVEPYWLHEISKIVELYESDVIFFDCNRIDEEDNMISDLKVSNELSEGTYSKEAIFKIVFSSSAINSVCLKTCKKSLFENYDLLTSFHHVRVGEDLLQTLPLLYNANSFFIIDKKLYNYRVNSQSVTHGLVKRHYEYITIVKPVVYEYMAKLHLDTEDNKRIFFTCSLNDLWRSLHSYFVLGQGDIDKKELISIANNECVSKAKRYLRRNKGISTKRKLGLYFFYWHNWFFLKLYFWFGEMINNKKKTNGV